MASGTGDGWKDTGAIANVDGVGATRIDEDAQRERKLSRFGIIGAVKGRKGS